MKNTSKKLMPVIALLIGSVFLASCATTASNPNDPYAKTKKGAMIGAAAGAFAGLFVGDGELDEVLGGAAVGAGLGAGIGVYMDKQQRDLEQIPDADVERIDEETLRVRFDSDILFAVDSATLSSGSMRALDDFANVMQEYPKTAILVQGFTDSTGSEQHNLALSERRANAVQNHLIRRGVDSSRMDAIGYGEAYPVADNSTAAGREQNRRVEILVKGKA